ncbi:MAG: sulfotransferase, partial [Chloroflexi bacterium]|nr:sulfotransferase [Chloroflexota bacterium]
MRKPDFFLAGAPKCGTRSMYEYLKPHPEIYLSPRKEPRYFASDLDTGTAGDELFFVRELDEYLGLFQGATDQKRVGEASVQYLYSRVAAENIRVFNPDSRFLVMLRNPVEAVHSMHAQRLAGGAEDIADFEAALDAEDDRREGRRIPPGSFHVKGLIYRDVARFGEQVERWLG